MKRNSIFFGLFLIFLAVFIIGTQINAFTEIGAVSIIATAIFAAMAIQSLFTLRFFGVFFPLAFLYMIYENPLALPNIKAGYLILIAFLLSVGFSALFGKKRRSFITKKHYRHHRNTNVENLDGEWVYARASFGGSTKYIHSKALSSGTLEASFGALEVFFDNARLSPQGATIDVQCRFGAVEIRVPRNWRVKDNIGVSLGNVENNAKGQDADSDLPVLNITGNVSFGSVEINTI